MKLLEKIDKYRRAEERRQQWLEKLYSSLIWDQILYVFYRSRGYFVRRSSRLARETIEVYAIAMVASLDVATIAFVLWGVSFVAHGLNEALFFSTRGLLAQSQRLSRQQALWAGGLINSGFVLGTVYYLDLQFSPEPWVWSFIAIRLIGFWLESLISFRTLEYSTRRRVYINPWFNLIWLGLGLGIAIVSVFALSGAQSLFTLVGVGVMLRWSEALVFWRATQRAEKLERLLEKSTPTRRRSERGLDWRSALDWSLPLVFVVSFGFLKELGHGLTNAKALLAWTILGQTLVQRPFMAMAVDIVKSVMQRQWRQASRIAHQACLLSRWILGVFALTACALWPHQGHWILTAAVVSWSWSEVLLTGLLGQVKMLSRERILWYAGLWLSAVVGHGFHWSYWIQLPVLGFFVWVHQKYIALPQSEKRLALGLEEHYARGHFKEASATRPLTSSYLWARNQGSLILDQRGMSHCEFILELNTSIRSPQKLNLFLDKVRARLRGTDWVVAWSSRHILLWLPMARPTDLPVIQDRFLMFFPLEVQSVSVMNESSIQSLSLSPVTKPIHKTWTGILMWSAWRVRENASRPERWWFLNSEGEWKNALGQSPSSNLRDQLDFFENRSTGDSFLGSSRTLWSLNRPKPFWVLKAGGVVVSVVEGELGDRRPLLLEQMQKELSAELLQFKNIQPPELRPLLGAWVMKLLTVIAKRVNHQIVQSPQTPHDEAKLVLEVLSHRAVPRRYWWIPESKGPKHVA